MTTKRDIYGDFYRDVTLLEDDIVDLRCRLDDIVYMVQDDDYNDLKETLESIDNVIGLIEGDIAQVSGEWCGGKEEEIREELRKEIL